jgi:hypothetical protein
MHDDALDARKTACDKGASYWLVPGIGKLYRWVGS